MNFWVRLIWVGEKVYTFRKMDNRPFLKVLQSVARFYNRSQQPLMSVTNRLWVQEKIDTYLLGKSDNVWTFRPGLYGGGQNITYGRERK